MAVKKPVMDSAFQLLAVTETVLINLHAFTITGSEGVCDEVCF